MHSDAIKVFIEKWLDLDLQLREKRGLNEDLYEDLLELLKEIKDALQDSDSVPKALAEIFVDMYGAMTSSADLYPESERSDIYQGASLLCDTARDICIDS